MKSEYLHKRNALCKLTFNKIVANGTLNAEINFRMCANLMTELHQRRNLLFLSNLLRRSFNEMREIKLQMLMYRISF